MSGKPVAGAGRGAAAGSKGSGGPEKMTPKIEREKLARQLLGTLGAETLDEVGYIRHSSHIIQVPTSTRKIRNDSDS